MSDLYYYRARYYDPHAQRFISMDPIEFESGDFNHYRYVGGDPVNFRDPSGLDEASAGDIIKNTAQSTLNSRAMNTTGGWVYDAMSQVEPQDILNWRDHVIPKIQGNDPTSKFIREMKQKDGVASCARKKALEKLKKKKKEEELKKYCTEPVVDEYGFEKIHSPYSEPCKTYFKSHPR